MTEPWHFGTEWPTRVVIPDDVDLSKPHWTSRKPGDPTLYVVGTDDQLAEHLADMIGDSND